MIQVILKSLKDDTQRIVLGEASDEKGAEQVRKDWRRVLGGNRWCVDRRPGLDTLDHLAISMEKLKEDKE